MGSPSMAGTNALMFARKRPIGSARSRRARAALLAQSNGEAGRRSLPACRVDADGGYGSTSLGAPCGTGFRGGCCPRGGRGVGRHCPGPASRAPGRAANVGALRDRHDRGRGRQTGFCSVSSRSLAKRAGGFGQLLVRAGTGRRSGDPAGASPPPTWFCASSAGRGHRRPRACAGDAWRSGRRGLHEFGSAGCCLRRR